MTPTLHLACLCAAWCRLCDDYAPVLAAAAETLAHDGVRLQLHWIDIEDEAELVGDFDVETFPTIVISTGTQVRFAGPVTPQAGTLIRLVRATVLETPPDAPTLQVAPEVQAFARRLDQRSAAPRP